MHDVCLCAYARVCVLACVCVYVGQMHGRNSQNMLKTAMACLEFTMPGMMPRQHLCFHSHTKEANYRYFILTLVLLPKGILHPFRTDVLSL